ncbi:MAG: DUF305 domain-containing protein [Limnobacter sp.]|nr:DUF305 domain-containing protein [Limnobacter sp.]
MLSTVFKKPSVFIAVLLCLLAGAFLGHALQADAFLQPSEKSHPKPNAVDIGFAQSMQLHHNQAIQMAMMVKKSESAQIRELAHSIMLSQTHETGLMKGMLSAWHEPTLPPGAAMEWVEHAENVTVLDDLLYQAQCRAAKGKMAGLATPEQLKRLAELQGTAQDEFFIELMLEHHKAALPMARFARNNGHSPLIKNLARAMINEQAQEIQWMTLNYPQKEDNPS